MKKLLLVAGFGLILGLVWLLLDILLQGYLYKAWVIPFARLV